MRCILMEWREIKNQADINTLMDEYYNFHDSCIISVNYISGANIDNSGGMRGVSKDSHLIIKFDSQIKRQSLELKFVGLRRINLIGYQYNYSSSIFECYLSFFGDFIVWSDNEYFDPNNYANLELLKEPMTTFVISDKLEWHLL